MKKTTWAESGRTGPTERGWGRQLTMGLGPVGGEGGWKQAAGQAGRLEGRWASRCWAEAGEAHAGKAHGAEVNGNGHGE